MKAISSMATRGVLSDLVAEAEAAGLSSAELESVGGVDAARRIAAGEPFDLVFLAADALDTLAVDGHVDAASVIPLVLSQVVAAVRGEATEVATIQDAVAFRDAEGVQAAVRAASRIGYSTGPSGAALLRLIDEWGLTHEVGDRLVQAPPGVPVAELVASGDADLGFQQLSEFVGQPGVRILGALPPACAIETVFSGAVATVSSDPARARELLAHLASDAASRTKAQHGFGIPPSGRTNDAPQRL